MEFEFEKRRVTKGEIRDLIFHEILEYHPQLNGTETTNFLYPRFCLFFLAKYFLFVCSTVLLSPCFSLIIFFTVLLINSKSSSLISRKLMVKVIQLCHSKENTHHFRGKLLMRWISLELTLSSAALSNVSTRSETKTTKQNTVAFVSMRCYYCSIHKGRNSIIF